MGRQEDRTGCLQELSQGGIKAINILEEDRLIEVKRTSGEDDVVLISHQGKSIRFNESDARSMGRATSGVRGINLVDTDRVVALSIEEGATLLVARKMVSENAPPSRNTVSSPEEAKESSLCVRVKRAVSSGLSVTNDEITHHREDR